MPPWRYSRRRAAGVVPAAPRPWVGAWAGARVAAGQRALGEEPVGVREGPRHALDGPLQDPVPGSLRDRPPASLPWPGPLPAPCPLPRASAPRSCPPPAVARRGHTGVVVPCGWALPVRCAPPRSYLTQERVELVPAQRCLAAGANTLCLRGETRPGSFPARPGPGRGSVPPRHSPSPSSWPLWHSSTTPAAGPGRPSRGSPSPPLPPRLPPAGAACCGTHLGCLQRVVSGRRGALQAACVWGPRAGRAEPQPPATHGVTQTVGIGPPPGEDLRAAYGGRRGGSPRVPARLRALSGCRESGEAAATDAPVTSAPPGAA